MLTPWRLIARAPRVALALALAAAALALLSALIVACESSDPTAPEGSTLTVSADPQTVVVQGGVAGVSEITATLRSSNGTRLPDQEVIFETTAGSLIPPAQTPDETDENGQVTTTLETSSTATVTARSGTISGSTTVQTVSGNLSVISLNVIPMDISTCTTTVMLVVEATDPNGNGVDNVTIRFEKSVPAGRNELVGSISPSQPRTDGSGLATATFTPSQNSCDMMCDPSIADPNVPNGAACAVDIVATDITGAFRSGVETITESIQ